jgi:hypothetical protein
MLLTRSPKVEPSACSSALWLSRERVMLPSEMPWASHKASTSPSGGGKDEVSSRRGIQVGLADVEVFVSGLCSP